MSITEGGTGPADDRPLTQQEYQLVQRLFSDPFSFPIAFKTWLVSYLETSDLNLPFSAVNGLVDLLGITGTSGGALGVLPAGLILPYGGLAAPAGSLLCDGASYPIANYPRLWAAISGSGFGQPDVNSFYVPDLRGRVPVGKGPHTDVSVMASNEGLAAASRTPKHTHKLAGDGTGNASTSGGNSDGWVMLTDYGPNAHSKPEVGKPVDAPPYAVLNFIIVA